MENLTAATGELRDRQDKLSRATAALIVAVKEAGEGPWEARSGLREEALLRWLLDQKRRELTMRTQVGEEKRKCEGFPEVRHKGGVDTRGADKA